jgi:hypothetical protein
MEEQEGVRGEGKGSGGEGGGLEECLRGSGRAGERYGVGGGAPVVIEAEEVVVVLRVMG